MAPRKGPRTTTLTWDSDSQERQAQIESFKERIAHFQAKIEMGLAAQSASLERIDAKIQRQLDAFKTGGERPWWIILYAYIFHVSSKGHGN